MKIIFIDKNEKLKELARLESRVDVSDISLDEIEADAISTCSNPDYDFAGGIDAYFAKRFNLKKGGKWLEVREGDKNIKNVVLNETVDEDRQANYELVRRAYVNFLNLARNKKWEAVVLTGFGTGVGGLSERDCIKALSEALDMMDTIDGNKNVPLIEINDVIVEYCHNMQAELCHNMQAKSCHNMQAKSCHDMQAKSCHNMQAKYCHDMQAKSCNNMQAKYCHNMQAEYCDNMQAESCHNMQAKYCHDMQAKSCHNMQAKFCHDMQAESCHNMQAEYCDNMQAELCNNMQAKSCNNMQAELCNNMQAKSCNNMQAEFCDNMQAEYCDNMQAKSCHNMQAKYCHEIFLLKCDGKTNACYTVQYKCKLHEVNAKGEDDFAEMFLSQFENNIAYKFLTKDWESPIADNKIKYKAGKEIKAECNENVDNDCSYGINLATLDWCLRWMQEDSILVAFEFDPKDAIIPNNTDGKFRVPKAKCLYGVDEEGNRLMQKGEKR